MIHITPADVTTAAAVLPAAPGRIRCLPADRGYDANHLRAALKTAGTRPAKGFTLHEFICQHWTAEPDRFQFDPLHQIPGLDT